MVPARTGICKGGESGVGDKVEICVAGNIDDEVEIFVADNVGGEVDSCVTGVLTGSSNPVIYDIPQVPRPIIHIPIMPISAHVRKVRP